jgi:hypothetical protein
MHENLGNTMKGLVMMEMGEGSILESGDFYKP